MAARMEDEEKPPLKLTIIGARNLRKADTGPFRSSDPYVIMQVEGRSEKFQTEVVKNNLNPEWNLDVEVKDYELGDDINFTLMDKDRITKDDFLGTARLSCAQWGHPDGFEGEVEISDGRPDSWLRVKVYPLPRKPDPEQNTAEQLESLAAPEQGKWCWFFGFCP